MERIDTIRMVRVTQDGSGDYLSVQDAVDSVPLGNTCRTVIRLSPGVYRQPVYVPKRKNFITFAGTSPEITVITWNNTASKIEHHQVFFLKTFLFLAAARVSLWLVCLSGVESHRDGNVWVRECYCRRWRLYCRERYFWERCSWGKCIKSVSLK